LLHNAEDADSSIPRNVGAASPHDAAKPRNDVETVSRKHEKEDSEWKYGPKINVVL
jgi:hypothetical protein